jgi:MYXO-CTERM domain-containing protein
VVPYLYWIATQIGFWTAGTIYAALAVLGFAAFVVSRRRKRNAASG